MHNLWRIFILLLKLNISFLFICLRIHLHKIITKVKFILPSKGSVIWSVKVKTLISVTFKKIVVEIFNNCSKDSCGMNVYKTRESCW